jgi:hypothetical protein
MPVPIARYRDLLISQKLSLRGCTTSVAGDANHWGSLDLGDRRKVPWSKGTNLNISRVKYF